jgi:4-hydroxy-tetrahydrodipicolinate reductase
LKNLLFRYIEARDVEEKMNIALIGYGKMGKAITKALPPYAINIIVDPLFNNEDKLSINKSNKEVLLLNKISDIPKEKLKNIDVFIEFTNPDSALANIKELIKIKDNAKIVSGTTAWNIKALGEILNKTQALVLHSSNFSLGINIISKALNSIARDLKNLGSFDASMVEYHHKNKKDAPSGTAKTLAKIIEEQDLACPVSSVRSGHYPGTHSICFDSDLETIEIKHTARSRDLFCKGVLISAEWLSKQKKPGLYSFNDVIG